MQNIINYISEHTYDFTTWGIIKFAIDILAVVAVIIGIFLLIKKKISVPKLLIILLCYGVLYLIGVALDLKLFCSLLNLAGVFGLFFIVIIYSQDIRHTVDAFFSTNKVDNSYSSKEEKEQIINVISATVEYLAERHIGALITFEREDNLDSIISKAISIDSVVTQEILTTIFTPGTACHDGGVIIRSNRVACAGAYYPATENFDVPKFLGTRHRAAIGISEKYDAITVVVSEETGNISLTIAGNISLGITIDRLEELLDSCLNIK